MLARLQGTLNRSDVEQMILVPSRDRLALEGSEINFVVGYSHSSNSQVALDMTLWIAHQTRLATSRSVTVQVVYVVEETTLPTLSSTGSDWRLASRRDARRGGAIVRSRSSEGVIASKGGTSVLEAPVDRVSQFEQADRILWQARCLADEWRGSLKTHLRFGNLADELRQVALTEDASLLIVGCESADHALVRCLGPNFPCPVLGIPQIPSEEI